MKDDRIKCPVCGRDVSVSWLGNIIHRHKSTIKKLNGAICSASNKTAYSYNYEGGIRP